MTFKELMWYLAEYHKEGILVACSIVCLSYLIFSIRLLYSSRDVGMKIWASAFIPVVNLILWVRKCFRAKRYRIKDTDEFEI